MGDFKGWAGLGDEAARVGKGWRRPYRADKPCRKDAGKAPWGLRPRDDLPSHEHAAWGLVILQNMQT